ncbi:MAG: serine hydrolase, partial [Blastocatellia bacterium]|nr:serine hydrolase [Blastocatellia bacterium]
MNRLKLTVGLVCLLVMGVGAQGPDRKAAIDAQIKAATADFKGKVWLHAKNLDTGAEFSLRGDEQVRTASTIKVPIMAEVYRQVAGGKIAWTDEFTVETGKTSGGSGILREFSDGSKVDLKTAMHLMIVLSDNTATNLILDKITLTSVNEYMKKLGLNDTLSLRRIGGGGDAKEWDEPVNKTFGIGRSSPRDMVRL